MSERRFRLGQAVIKAMKNKRIKEEKQSAEEALQKSEHYFRSLS